jgi:GxxExxY protein
VIKGAAQEVHRVLGPGFEEIIYQCALAKELPAHNLDHTREVWIDVLYKGEKVGRKRVDFVAFTPSVCQWFLSRVRKIFQPGARGNVFRYSS